MPTGKSKFTSDRNSVIDNLDAIRAVLSECIDKGLLDEDDHFYNEINDLIEQAELSKTYPELSEVISRAQTIETDIDAWLSLKGLATLSLTWPSANQ